MTEVAAKDAGVRSIGIELGEKWCEYTVGRCAQQSLFAEGAA